MAFMSNGESTVEDLDEDNFDVEVVELRDLQPNSSLLQRGRIVAYESEEGQLNVLPDGTFVITRITCNADEEISYIFVASYFGKAQGRTAEFTFGSEVTAYI